MYLVEYPFAIGASRRVAETSNCVNFHGYDVMEGIISGPTGLARSTNWALELVMIKVRGLPELLARFWRAWMQSGCGGRS